MMRFISVRRGYTMLAQLGHLKTELDAWLEVSESEGGRGREGEREREREREGERTSFKCVF